MDSNVSSREKHKNIAHQLSGWCVTKITQGVSLVCDKEGNEGVDVDGWREKNEVKKSLYLTK